MKAVGMLGSASGDPYWLRLVQATAQSTRKEGHHAVCFVGGYPRAPYFRDGKEQLQLPSVCDAWVLLSSSLHAPAPELTALADSSPACVSVGVELAGHPTLASSDETGIFQAVAHLARRHARRRIAFIGGPSNHPEAERRAAAYRLALESVGLAVDPSLMVGGNFEPSSGREAIRQLQRQAKRYDAVVAANDQMALGAVEALRASGQRVPEGISVIGFDDSEEASFASPTLTTVRQPLQELGASAARSAALLLAGSSVEASTIITAPLVIRESCGCRPDAEAPERRPNTPSGPPVSQSLRENALRDLVRRELASSRERRELGGFAEAMLGASDYPDLAAPLSRAAGVLDVRLSVATYSGGQRHARVLLESRGSSVVFHQHTESHPFEQLIPRAFLRQAEPRELVVLALELGEEQLGYLVIDGALRDATAYIELRRTLSAALARIAQSRELRRLYAAERKRA